MVPTPTLPERNACTANSATRALALLNELLANHTALLQPSYAQSMRQARTSIQRRLACDNFLGE